MDQDAISLQYFIPFRFLSREHEELIRAHMTIERYTPGDVVVSGHADKDTRVFLILQGRVEIRKSDPGKTPAILERGEFFGEHTALFGVPRTFSAYALDDVRCAVIEGETLAEVLRKDLYFAHALGDILRMKKGLLKHFDAFIARIMNDVSNQHVNLPKVLDRYMELNPALHPLLHSAEIDFNALGYAVARLPENITSTFGIFLCDNLPDIYQRLTSCGTPVVTRARRRTVVEMMPGKIMVLLRDGMSDLLDFISCLCLYIVEARKIRRKLASESTIALFLEHRDHMDDPKLVDLLPLSDDEKASLRLLWGPQTFATLYNIVLHHEDFGLEINKQLSSFNAQHSERWTLQIAHGVKSLLGFDPRDLPDDVPIHIISSNTHSVANCLSPYLAQHRDTILSWGQVHTPDLLALSWTNSTDPLYAVARAYFKAHPEEAQERLRVDEQAGIRKLPESAFTGIQVGLIHLEQLAGHPIDPDLGTVDPSQRGLIVNIDYAFGQQAEEIISNLITLFGHRVASINILGKAGSLVGVRGDILVASAFVEQSGDSLSTLPRHLNIDTERLAARIPHLTVHEGPLLTVAGTLLQNETMLRFYRHIWQCIGLEMEGTYYLRRILKAQALSLLPNNIPMRFVYYVSDLPLDHNSTLAGPLLPNEGIPPLYAITREILADFTTQL